MSLNPYQSPTAPREPAGGQEPRRLAQMKLRAATLLLLVPALLNNIAFDLTYIEWSATLAATVKQIYRTVNDIAFVAGIVGIWLGGLPLLERGAGIIRRMVAPQTSQEQWLEALYRSLHGIVVPAAIGAMVWIVWLLGFYVAKIGYISLLVAVPAHLLAAVVYVPLLYRWWRLAATPDLA